MEVAAPPQGRARLEPRRRPTTKNMKYAPPVFLSRRARFEPSPRLLRRRRAHPDHRVAAVAGGARGGGVEPHRAGIARHRTVARPRHLRGEGGCTEARIPSVGPVGVRSNSSRCGGDGFGGRALLSGRVEAVSGYSSSAVAEWPRLRVEPCVCHIYDIVCNPFGLNWVLIPIQFCGERAPPSYTLTSIH